MEQIQQLKEQIKILEQQELEKKRTKEKNDIEYNLEIVNKMIDNISQMTYGDSEDESIDNNTIPQNELDHESLYDIYLHNCLSKIYKVLSLMNKEITIIKNTNV
jgi:hypothetical protein